eukprot:scaffold5581_cov229-Prasinococcus_capsulatus_cf.AAC.3
MPCNERRTVCDIRAPPSSRNDMRRAARKRSPTLRLRVGRTCASTEPRLGPHGGGLSLRPIPIKIDPSPCTRGSGGSRTNRWPSAWAKVSCILSQHPAAVG